MKGELDFVGRVVSRKGGERQTVEGTRVDERSVRKDVGHEDSKGIGK